MPVQTAYVNQATGFAGLRQGGGAFGTRTRINDAGNVAQVDDITVSDATATFQFEINGIAVTFVAGAAETATTIRDALILAVRANIDFEDLVSANPVGAADLRLTSLQPGIGYTLTESDANLAVASVTANVARVEIAFGLGVFQGTADTSGIIPAGAGQFVGVNELVYGDVAPVTTPKNGTAADANMTLVHAGKMWVKVEEAVAIGDSVFVRHTTGTGTELGAFRTDADTATAQELTNSKFDSSTTGAGIALVSLNEA